MDSIFKKFIALFILAFVSLSFTACATTNYGGKTTPIVIKGQGSFAVGGKIITTPGTFDPIKQGAYNPAGPDSTGQTLHGDHAYVFFQIPENPRKLPLVFWHGYGQSSKTWESTPDGRDGFQNIFLRKGFPVYLLDQPRRGKAGKSTVDILVPVAPDEQLWFGIFRIGLWPEYYDNVAFPQDTESLNQFFRQAVPSPNSFDLEVNTSAVSAIFDKIGQGILVTHSASGSPGFHTVIKNSNIKAVVSFEPGMNYPFPESEALPEPVPFNTGKTYPISTVPDADFEKLTRIPIVIYFGDNIAEEPSKNPGQDQWRVYLATAKKWAAVVNRHGGDVTIMHLPEIGVYGNTHFPMSDLNNDKIADLMSDWLSKKGLD